MPNPDCTVCNGTGEDPDFGGTCSMCEGFIPRMGGMGETLHNHRTSSSAPKVSHKAEAVDDSWKRRPRWKKEGDTFYIVIPKNIKDAKPGDTVTISKADGTTKEEVLGSVYDKNDWGDTLWIPAPKVSTHTHTEVERYMPVHQRPASVAADEGMYRTSDGTIYKVVLAVHGSGFPYAKRLVPLDEPVVLKNGKVKTHDFEIAKGMQFKLRPEDKMSFDEAKEWGTLYGACCVCGITLTNEESIERGIGPVCASKF